ncbi:hypothetical protein MTO96_036770 [Rhipicephalus appendiculatus]
MRRMVINGNFHRERCIWRLEASSSFLLLIFGVIMLLPSVGLYCGTPPMKVKVLMKLSKSCEKYLVNAQAPDKRQQRLVLKVINQFKEKVILFLSLQNKVYTGIIDTSDVIPAWKTFPHGFTDISLHQQGKSSLEKMLQDESTVFLHLLGESVDKDTLDVLSSNNGLQCFLVTPDMLGSGCSERDELWNDPLSLDMAKEIDEAVTIPVGIGTSSALFEISPNKDTCEIVGKVKHVSQECQLPVTPRMTCGEEVYQLETNNTLRLLKKYAKSHGFSTYILLDVDNGIDVDAFFGRDMMLLK